MAEIGAFRDPIQGKHDKKRGEKIPLETCVFTLGLENTTQQKRFAFCFGISFYFDERGKRKKKNLGEMGKKGEKRAREKLFGSGYEIEPPLEGEGNGNLVLKRESLSPTIVTLTWFAVEDR